jgi:hypothetical protein
MTDPLERNDETVRIPLPAAGVVPTESQETVPIHLPTLPPANPSHVPTANSSSAAARTPKKETARISVLSNPPLIDLPPAQRQETAVTVAPETPSPSHVEIPVFLCWGLLGISTATLILQIWNYLS